MKNKKKTALILSIMCILALALGTAAYYTTSDTAVSTVKASNLEVKLVMLEDDGSGNQIPVNTNTTILPGETKSRIAKVTNVGKEPAWVRVDALVNAPHGVENIEEFGYIELGNVDDKHWAHRDGYWYYDKALAPGETTESLFTEISFTDDITDNYKGKDLTVTVVAQGTQEKHNGSTAFDAQGWPEE